MICSLFDDVSPVTILTVCAILSLSALLVVHTDIVSPLITGATLDERNASAIEFWSGGHIQPLRRNSNIAAWLIHDASTYLYGPETFQPSNGAPGQTPLQRGMKVTLTAHMFALRIGNSTTGIMLAHGRTVVWFSGLGLAWL